MPSAAHAEMVEQIIATGQRTPEERPTAELMAAIRKNELASVPPTPDDMQVDDTTVGGVPCIVVSPRANESVGTIVFVHGGGYIWMTARTHLLVAAGLVRASGCRCVSVEYRRAPEHPYPAPVDDLVAVYRGLLRDGVPADRIVFAGDSAGGGLVVGGLVALRDAGDALPAAAVSISPWTDLAVTGASADTVDDPIVSGTALRMMASMYLDGASPTSPTASPLYADVRGLPPLLVLVGTREALLDDARRLVERARKAGVDVTLSEYADVVHMWVAIGPDIPESLAAFREAGAFIGAHVA